MSRRALVAASIWVLALAAAAFAIWNAERSGSPPWPNVVAWRALPPLVAGPPARSWCRIADFHMSRVEQQPATQEMVTWFSLSYRGKRTCRLGKVLGSLTHSGRRRSPEFDFRRSRDASRENFDRLAPGDRIELVLTSDYYCGLDPPARPGSRGSFSIRLRFSRGGSRLVGSGGTCAVSGVSWPRIDPKPNPYPIDFELVLEQRRRPSGTIRYAMILKNVGRREVALSPCPVFVEDLSIIPEAGKDIDTEEAHRLDCASHRLMRPGESVRYELQMRVPPVLVGPVIDAELFLMMEDERLSTSIDLTRLFNRRSN